MHGTEIRIKAKSKNVCEWENSELIYRDWPYLPRITMFNIIAFLSNSRIFAHIFIRFFDSVFGFGFFVVVTWLRDNNEPITTSNYNANLCLVFDVAYLHYLNHWEARARTAIAVKLFDSWSCWKTKICNLLHICRCLPVSGRNLQRKKKMQRKIIHCLRGGLISSKIDVHVSIVFDLVLWLSNGLHVLWNRNERK